MKRGIRNPSVLTMVLSVAMLAASTARAADTVLDLIPDDALAFAVVNRIGQTDAKIEQLAQSMKKPSTEETLLEMLQKKFHVKEGLDRQRAVAIVAMPSSRPAGHPDPVVLVPITDYKAFVGQFEPKEVTSNISRVTFGREDGLMANKDGYAVVVESHKQALLESLLAGKTSIAESVAPWKTWIDESDAVAVVTAQGVKLFTDRASKELDKMKPIFEKMGPQGAQAAAVFAMYQQMLATAGKEFTAVGAGVVIEKDNSIHLTGMARFKPGGEWAGWFTDVEPLAANPWAGVPNEPYALAGAGVLPEGLMKGLMGFSMNANSNIYGLNDEQMKKLAAMSVESMKDVRAMAMSFGVVEPGRPLYQAVTATFRVADSQAFLDQYANLVKSMAQLAADADQSMLKGMTAVPVEIAGCKGIDLTVNLSGLYENPQFVQFTPIFKAMYGPENEMHAYLVAADKTTVAVAYLDRDRAELAVKAATQPGESLAANASLALMTKRLPEDAQWLMFWDLQGTIKLVQRVIDVAAPAGVIELPEFPAAPPVAVGVTVSPTEARKDVLIPAEVLQAVPGYVGQIKQSLRSRHEPEEF
ncbi:MAG: hypothetical protein JW719_13505 [Pirellulales bacterium]|nr:hypothetical protein [Pirellulales bacterium]